jgi:5'-3' exonuclease
MNVLLIDLSSIAHREFHVSGDNPDPDATAQKTVARVRALGSGKPHVGICIDTPPYFRRDIDPQYKANRAKDNNAVIAYQIAHAIDTLQADGFPVFGAAGYEADDIIATLTGDALRNNAEHVTIATADKDLFQLVSDSVSIHSIRSGNVYDGQAVKEKLGVEPHQVADYLALVGDSSDNIQGAKGIGAKRAAELLDIFGNADDAIRAAKEIIAENGKKATAVEKSLVEFEARLPTVRDLIRLRTDAPIDCAPLFKERASMEDNSYEEQGADDELGAILDAAGQPADAEEAEAVSRPVENARPVVYPAGPAPVRRDEPGGIHPAPIRTAEPTALAVVDLAPVPAEWSMQLEPRSIDQAWKMAMRMFGSKIFGAWGSPEAVLAIIMSGREFGMPTQAALRGFDNINGKPAMKADLIRALILRSGKVEYFDCTERTDERCAFVIKRVGRPEVSMTYTIEQAKKAWKKDQRAWENSGYVTNPADMLVARCSSKLGRLVCPDVTHGLYAVEEMRDFSD